MKLSLNDSNKEFDFVCWVIKTPWLIYFRSVKFHCFTLLKKHTDVSSVLALVKTVVASQLKKRQRKKSLSTFVDNWKHRLGLESKCTRCTMQISYSYASDLPFKNFSKLAKRAETIKNRFWLWLSIVWETRKLTLYQPGVKSFLT